MLELQRLVQMWRQSGSLGWGRRPAHLSKGLGFSREDRDENIRRIGFVCELLSRNGVIAIAAAISPTARYAKKFARASRISSKFIWSVLWKFWPRAM